MSSNCTCSNNNSRILVVYVGFNGGPASDIDVLVSRAKEYTKSLPLDFVTVYIPTIKLDRYEIKLETI